MVSSELNSGDALEREMYLLRRMTAKLLVDQGFDWRRDMYFCSLSSRTVVYKGMTNANVSVAVCEREPGNVGGVGVVCVGAGVGVGVGAFGVGVLLVLLMLVFFVMFVVGGVVGDFL